MDEQQRHKLAGILEDLSHTFGVRLHIGEPLWPTPEQAAAHQQLREAFERSGWTEEGLARSAEVHVKTVQRALAGQLQGVETYHRLLVGLGCSISAPTAQPSDGTAGATGEPIGAAEGTGEASAKALWVDLSDALPRDQLGAYDRGLTLLDAGEAILPLSESRGKVYVSEPTDLDELLRCADALADGYVGWPKQPQSAEPMELPLAKALGPSWRFFEDKLRAVTVLLHDSGLWLEADAAWLWETDAEEAEVLRVALDKAVRKGLTGCCQVKTTRRQTPDPENPGRVLRDEVLAHVEPVPARRPLLVLDLSRADRIHWEQVERLVETVQQVLETSGAVEFKDGPMDEARSLLRQGAQLVADGEPSELGQRWLETVRAVLQPQSVKPTDGEGE